MCSDLAVWIEPKLRSASLRVGFGFTPALLIWCLKRAQASHFIEDAFRVQLAFQPLERAIHWFAFSNNDFWHQFTSIPKKFAHSNPGREQFTPAVYAASNRVREGPFRRPEKANQLQITQIKRTMSVEASSRLPAWFASK